MAGIIARAGASITGTLSGSLPFDPYQIAYLRGGAREVLKLRLFELMQLGYLVVTEKKRLHGTERWLTVAPDAPSRQHLPNIDKHLLAYCETPRTATDILSLRFPTDLENACRNFRQELRQRGLLQGRLARESKTFRSISYAVVALFLLALFGGPIVTQTGPVALLAMIAFALANGLLESRLACNASVAGREHLRTLEAQYTPYAERDRAQWEQVPPVSQFAAVAVLGFGILQSGPFDAFASLLGTQVQGGVEYGVESGGGCDSGCGGCGGCGG
jgi:uncharacterized protein (TIGR04222 family)